MDESRINKRQALEAQLINRAMKDETFRQELLRDPKGVFERELGIQVPEHIDVQVLQESPSMVYLVLPPPTQSVGAELSDTELEAVVGGEGAPNDGFTRGDCWSGLLDTSFSSLWPAFRPLSASRPFNHRGQAFYYHGA